MNEIFFRKKDGEQAIREALEKASPSLFLIDLDQRNAHGQPCHMKTLDLTNDDDFQYAKGVASDFVDKLWSNGKIELGRVMAYRCRCMGLSRVTTDDATGQSQKYLPPACMDDVTSIFLSAPMFRLAGEEPNLVLKMMFTAIWSACKHSDGWCQRAVNVTFAYYSGLIPPSVFDTFKSSEEGQVRCKKHCAFTMLEGLAKKMKETLSKKLTQFCNCYLSGVKKSQSGFGECISFTILNDELCDGVPG